VLRFHSSVAHCCSALLHTLTLSHARRATTCSRLWAVVWWMWQCRCLKKSQLFELCYHHCHVALLHSYSATLPNCVPPFLESVSEVYVGSRKIKPVLDNLSTVQWCTLSFRNCAQNSPPVVLYRNINRSQLPAVLFRVEELSKWGTVQIMNIFPTSNFAKLFHLFRLWSRHKAIDSSCFENKALSSIIHLCFDIEREIR